MSTTLYLQVTNRVLDRVDALHQTLECMKSTVSREAFLKLFYFEVDKFFDYITTSIGELGNGCYDLLEDHICTIRNRLIDIHVSYFHPEAGSFSTDFIFSQLKRDLVHIVQSEDIFGSPVR